MAKNEAIWTTKDGRIILVKDMDDTHLVNALKLCIRVAQVIAGRDDALWMSTMPDDLVFELWDDMDYSPLSEHYPKGTEDLLKENSIRKLLNVEEYITSTSSIRLLATLQRLVKK